jgi:hypothetical protein
MEPVEAQADRTVRPELAALAKQIARRVQARRQAQEEATRPGSDLAVVALVAANLTPLVGMVAFDWKLFDVIFLYWLESAVIAFYNVLKIVCITHVLSFLFVPFFLFHFGGFMSIHAVLLSAFFGTGEEIRDGGLFSMWPILWEAWHATRWPIASLLVSHGVSFVANFLIGGEIRRTSIGALMDGPYKRIFIMQLTVIFGGWLVMLTGAKSFGLLVLIATKTAADIHAHRREHAGPEPSATVRTDDPGAVAECAPVTPMPPPRPRE